MLFPSILASIWPWRPRFIAGRGLASLALALVLFSAIGCDSKRVLAPEAMNVAADTSGGLGLSTQDPTCLRRAQGQALHLEGRSASGALWVIDKPAAWNGDLVVYLHGYTNPAQPVALPNNGPIRDSLLARGFAVTTSSYSSNGYAVQEGIHDSRQLSHRFAWQVARPRHTYLLGQSLGGLIGLLMTQQFPEQYDGSLLVSGIVGGSDEEVQYLGDIRVLFDAVYPNVLAGSLENPPVITDVNAQVVQPILQAINANPQGLGIIQLLARRPLPGISNQEVAGSLINVLGFGMQGGGDLFARTHGHSFFDNATWRYTSAALPPALLDDINARVARYSIAPDAAAFLARFGEPSGNLRIPVITMHKTRDPLVPVFHEDILGQVAAGPSLVQKRVEGYGHADFSAGELMVSFQELVAMTANQHAAIF